MKPEFHSKIRRLIHDILLAEYLRKYENCFYKTALTHGTSKEIKERKIKEGKSHICIHILIQKRVFLFQLKSTL